MRRDCVPHAVGLAVPTVTHGPYGLVPQAHGCQRTTDQHGTLKIEHGGQLARIGRGVTKAKRLHRHRVKGVRSPRRNHALQEVNLVNGRVPTVGCRRQRGRGDDGVRVGGADGRRHGFEQLGIGNRLDPMVAPVRRNVRLVPHLVVTHLVTVAGGKSSGKPGHIVGVGRRRQGVIHRRTVLFGPRPRRAAVEQDQRNQAVVHDIVDPGIGSGPVIDAGLRFQGAPIETEPHPVKAGMAQRGQGGLALARRNGLRVDVDAGERQTGSRCLF